MKSSAVIALLVAFGCAGAAPVVVARVSDGEAGRPLAGAVVTAEGSDIMAVTDSEGRCELVAAPRKGGFFTASRPGYLDYARRDSWPKKPAPDTVVLDLPLYSNKPRFVQGRVFDDISRAGLAEAAVSVDTVSVRAGPDGWFQISGFPAGPRALLATFDGYAAGTARVLARGGETTEVSLGLRDTANTGSVTGVVRAVTTGGTLAGVLIQLDSTDVSCVSDSAGDYGFENLPAGVYGLTATAVGYLKGVTRFRVVKGWAVEVNLGLWRPGEEPKPVRARKSKRR